MKLVNALLLPFEGVRAGVEDDMHPEALNLLHDPRGCGKVGS